MSKKLHFNAIPYLYDKNGQPLEYDADDAVVWATDKQKQRFYSNVIKHKSGCWLYQKLKDNILGYGKYNVNKRGMLAHRAALIWATGAPKKGLGIVARHKCRSRNCVNVDHLEWGTMRQNNHDKRRDGTNNPWTHCGERHAWAKITDKDAIKICKLFKTGKFSPKYLGKKFNLSERSIHCILRGDNWRIVTDGYRPTIEHFAKKHHQRGAGHYATHLTNSEVKKMRLLYADGASLARLAERFKTSAGNVRCIVRRETWKHI